MFRQSSSRNSRTKGIRVKHVLQICLLLGVCFWLIYQVKHSHDKKKEFDEKDALISAKIQGRNDVLRFGRKELRPHAEEVTTRSEKHEDEEEEEEAGGEDQLPRDKIDAVENERHEEETEEEEEENKHEEEDRDEEEETKHDEKEEEEEESKNGETEEGDDEVDERDQEKADHIEDFVDEEKVNDEKDGEVTENEEKEDQVENDNSPEHQDHDEVSQNTHEAREEHYKGDDASSAVAHDTQVITTETENLKSETLVENSEMQENKPGNTTETNDDRKSSSVMVGEGQMAENDVLNVTSWEENVNNSSPYKPADGESLHLNSTLATELSEQLQVSNGSTEVSTTGENRVTELSSPQNGTETVPEIKLQNATAGQGTTLQTIGLERADNVTTPPSSDQSDSSSTLHYTEKFYGSSEHINSSNHLELPVSENTTMSNTTVQAENTYGSPTKEGTTDPAQNEDSDASNESSETNESSGSSTDENSDAAQHNPLDSSISRDVENRIDLDVLPEFKTEGDSNDDAAAE